MLLIDLYCMISVLVIAHLSIVRMAQWREIGASAFILAGILWPAYLYVLYADQGFDG